MSASTQDNSGNLIHLKSQSASTEANWTDRMSTMVASSLEAAILGTKKLEETLSAQLEQEKFQHKKTKEKLLQYHTELVAIQNNVKELKITQQHNQALEQKLTELHQESTLNKEKLEEEKRRNQQLEFYAKKYQFDLQNALMQITQNKKELVRHETAADSARTELLLRNLNPPANTWRSHKKTCTPYGKIWKKRAPRTTSCHFVKKKRKPPVKILKGNSKQSAMNGKTPKINSAIYF